MNYETLLVQKDEGVGVITLNRPDKLNAMSGPMGTELPLILAEMAADPSVRVVVITGSGRGFCTGADLSALGNVTESSGKTSDRGQAAKFGAALRSSQENIVLKMRRMGKPMIGAINGDAVGAGFGLALACEAQLHGQLERYANHAGGKPSAVEH